MRYISKGNWCENSSLIFIDKKKIVKGKKTCSCSAIAFFFPSVSTVCFSLRHWSSLYLFVRQDVSLYLYISLSLSLPPPHSCREGGGKKLLRNFCLSRMQLAHMLFLSVCFTLYYHAHLLQLLHSTANVSEQITLTGFWGCPWVSSKGMTGVRDKRGLQRRLTGQEGRWKGAAFDYRIRVCFLFFFFSYLFLVLF